MSRSSYFRTDVVEGFILLVCDVLSLGERLQTYRMIVVSSSWRM